MADSAKYTDSQFLLTSTSIKENEQICLKHVYDGSDYKGHNLSPDLSWSGAPDLTKSFAITLYDPDAPTGSGWWHWLIYNIPANICSLPEGAGSLDNHLLPKEIQMGRNDFGLKCYGGPCPPAGREHRYIFTIFALNVDKIEVPENASAAMIGFNLYSNCISKTSITSLYKI